MNLLALWKDLHKYKHLVEQIVLLAPATMIRYVDFDELVFPSPFFLSFLFKLWCLLEENKNPNAKFYEPN
jgi:hypothetical protein